jgi:putative NADH-flavin reductase
MKIALVGATGFVGSHLLAEAKRRGHVITAIARRVDALPAAEGVTPVRGDVADEAEMAAKVSGHDAVITATKFVRTDAGKLIRTVKLAKVPRWLVVGGAGSLEVAPGVALVDTPNFPAEYRAEAAAGRAFLDTLRKEKELDWTFLSPSALLEPGPRTGKFRLGDDQLLVDATGNSHISVADYAVAMMDELERPQHSRKRFTVGY